MKYSIKELEKITGIKAHTIRIWEKRYNLVTPYRTDTNIRYYDDEQLKDFLNITLLLSKGYKISEISRLSKDEIYEATKQVYDDSEHLNKVQVHYMDDINHLIVSMLDLDIIKFEKVFSQLVLRRGFENTIVQVICSFLEKLDVLWQTSEISISHQNFIIHLIRQKLYVALDGFIECHLKGKRALLFLPKNSSNDVFLLMADYILKRKGHQTIFIGSESGSLSLKAIVNTFKPDFFVSYSSGIKAAEELKSILGSIHDLLLEKPVFVIGDKELNSVLVQTNLATCLSIADFTHYLQHNTI